LARYLEIATRIKKTIGVKINRQKIRTWGTCLGRSETTHCRTLEKLNLVGIECLSAENMAAEY